MRMVVGKGRGDRVRAEGVLWGRGGWIG